MRSLMFLKPSASSDGTPAKKETKKDAKKRKAAENMNLLAAGRLRNEVQEPAVEMLSGC